MNPSWKKSNSRRFWTVVSTFGALWGATEATLGAYMHGLKLPMTGMMMATVGVVILISQRSVYNVRGVTLATGIVAAMCKSLSPAGVIWGPMIGITTEALLVEMALLAGMWAGAVMGGALAVTWAVFQKVLTHWILFGTTVLDLYVEVAKRGLALVNLSETAGLRIAGLAIGLVALWGVGAGVFGRAFGVRAREKLSKHRENSWPNMLGRDDVATPFKFISVGSSGGFAQNSRRVAPLAILAVVVVALQFGGDVWLSVLALAIWLGGLAVFNGVSPRRLFRIRLLASAALVGIGAGILLGEKDLTVAGIPVSTKGMYAGLLMVVRGALIYSMTAWAGELVQKERMLAVMGKIGLENLARAVSAGTGVVPALVETYRRERKEKVGLTRIAAGMFDQTVAKSLLTPDLGGVRVIAVTGERRVGKSSALARVADELRCTGIAVGGIVQTGMDGPQGRAGYSVTDLLSNETIGFAHRDPTHEQVGFVVENGAWEFAKMAIHNGLAGADVIFVDELGLVESRGGGHIASLAEFDGSTLPLVMLAGVRAEALEDVSAWIGGFDLVIRMGEGVTFDSVVSELIGFAIDGVKR